MDKDKSVDESWKDAADRDKLIIGSEEEASGETPKLHINEPFSQDEEETAVTEHSEAENSEAGFEVNFMNYITSLGFQALIFMGEIPNPATNEKEKNLDQAKFLIDTLAMMRDKTKGNLTEQEDNLLNASVYELQLKYVDCVKREGSEDSKESA